MDRTRHIVILAVFHRFSFSLHSRQACPSEQEGHAVLYGVDSVDVELGGDLAAVAGVGDPVMDVGFEDHAHFKEGAEDSAVLL